MRKSKSRTRRWTRGNSAKKLLLPPSAHPVAHSSELRRATDCKSSGLSGRKMAANAQDQRSPAWPAIPHLRALRRQSLWRSGLHRRELRSWPMGQGRRRGLPEHETDTRAARQAGK
jgi:hypothetical protein